MQREAGGIPYTLTYKNVKQIHLRVQAGGAVAVSAPFHLQPRTVDVLVAQKAVWIRSAQAAQIRKQAALASVDSADSDEACLAYFQRISDRIYPLCAALLKEKPRLRVKVMASRWGVCHLQKKTVTLNKVLINLPIEAAEYVLLHEYIHFLHPDHQRAFHETMRRLMPDCKERRKLLQW